MACRVQPEGIMHSDHVGYHRTAAAFGILLLGGLQAFGAWATGIKRPQFGEKVEVLVHYATQPTAEHHRKVTSRNGRVRAAFEHVPVVHYEVTAEALAELEADPDVVSISPNQPVAAFLDHARISANFSPLQAIYNTSGRSKAANIGVAILDSGVNPAMSTFHRYGSTRSRIVYSQSFVGGDTNDEFGHAAGDQVLRRAGEILMAAVEQPAKAARIGGDEFAILMPGDNERAGRALMRFFRSLAMTPAIATADRAAARYWRLCLSLVALAA